MKGATMLATLYQLGITPSNSRLRVSNDNPYAESLFITLKYRPDYQPIGFATIEEARAWVGLFVKWYNCEHHHSGLNFLTPWQCRSGEGDAILAKRHEVYEKAKMEHPGRCKDRPTRNWSLPKAVCLNPDRAQTEAILDRIIDRVEYFSLSGASYRGRDRNVHHIKIDSAPLTVSGRR